MTLPTASQSGVFGHDGSGVRSVLPSVFAGLAAAIEAPKQSRPRAATTAASVNALTGPNDSCEAVGSVTGFQMVADGVRAPFKAREDGSLVAWALDVSKPKKSEAKFFGDFYESNQFGMAPTARISVIKRKDERNYKLKSQSPVVGLNSVLGTRQTVTLTDPLKIRKGEFLALTIPTWAPSFAVGLSSDSNLWRSSRDAGQCGATDPNRSRRQAAAEGRVEPAVRLRLQGRPAPLLGLLRPALKPRSPPTPTG